MGKSKRYNPSGFVTRRMMLAQVGVSMPRCRTGGFGRGQAMRGLKTGGVTAAEAAYAAGKRLIKDGAKISIRSAEEVPDEDFPRYKAVARGAGYAVRRAKPRE